VSQTKTRKWRWGVNRWIVLALIILGAIFARAYPPLRPHVQLPAERLGQPLFTLPVIGEFTLTNTIVATLVADVVLILIGLRVRAAARTGALSLGGLAGAAGAMVEALYNLTESTAGKWAKTIFPWVATIVLLVLVANWTELIPGVDSIGLLERHHIEEPEHCSFDTLFHLGATEVVAVGGEHECAAGIVPFVRVASSDLNFTVALAIVSVVGTQIVGLRSLGGHYPSKFFNTRTLFTRPMFGVIDLLVSILEAILEAVKVLSFSFRLFGNIFAGSILLFFIGSQIPVFMQSGVLLFEWFVGIIQALVFGMLTLIFMSLATVGHGDAEGHPA
jgi:F-type H+-transporting ATPase subunit a